MYPFWVKLINMNVEKNSGYQNQVSEWREREIPTHKTQKGTVGFQHFGFITVFIRVSGFFILALVGQAQFTCISACSVCCCVEWRELHLHKQPRAWGKRWLGSSLCTWTLYHVVPSHKSGGGKISGYRISSNSNPGSLIIRGPFCMGY
jgi:hypothetical protein